MRITSEAHDSIHTTHVMRAKIVVRFEGELQRDVIVADEERGYVERIKRDRQGGLVIEDGNFVTERLLGTVQVQTVRSSSA